MILQMPIPGGPELVIILLVLVLLAAFVAVPLGLVVLGYRWWRGRDDADDAQIEELRARIEELEAQVAADEDR
jgi:cell division protein FtsB